MIIYDLRIAFMAFAEKIFFHLYLPFNLLTFIDKLYFFTIKNKTCRKHVCITTLQLGV